MLRMRMAGLPSIRPRHAATNDLCKQFSKPGVILRAVTRTETLRSTSHEHACVQSWSSCYQMEVDTWLSESSSQEFSAESRFFCGGGCPYGAATWNGRRESDCQRGCGKGIAKAEHQGSRFYFFPAGGMATGLTAEQQRAAEAKVEEQWRTETSGIMVVHPSGVTRPLGECSQYRRSRHVLALIACLFGGAGLVATLPGACSIRRRAGTLSFSGFRVASMELVRVPDRLYVCTTGGACGRVPRGRPGNRRRC